MVELKIERGSSAPLKILCLGAHADDLEIGCGGTILTLLRRPGSAHIWWVVFCSDKTRAQEATAGAEQFLEGAQDCHVIVKSFRDGFLPYEGMKVKEFFEELKSQCSPDVIFTHKQEDRHQDHRLISELTWNTFRDHLILEYEIPKFDGDLGSPNVFVSLDEAILKRKTDSILSIFSSQAGNYWLTEDLLRGVARIRGIESGPNGPFAEAFFARKAILSL